MIGDMHFNYEKMHCAFSSHKSSEDLRMISSQLKWYQMFTNSALWRRSFIMMFNWGMVNMSTVLDLHLCVS